MNSILSPKLCRLAVFASLVPLLTLPGAARADEVRLLARAGTGAPVVYAPFRAGRAPNTYVWLNADNLASQTELRATQRSLGFREVDYKAFVSAALTMSPVIPMVSGDITTYDYSAQSSKGTNLVAFWKDKDLPIIVGPDGKAYITDGHHTTAGYLAAKLAMPREMVPGNSHVVLGHIVANYFSGVPAIPDDAWWQTQQVANNAFLFGPNGNQLTQPTDRAFSDLQPIRPSQLAMPTVPGKSSMTNDDYRSLTWGMVDPVVKTASTGTAGTSYIKGFSKGFPSGWVSPDPIGINPNTSDDINFVEFYWADFLRNRVVWNNAAPGCPLDSSDAACVGKKNLIAAPVSFFAAVANGIALARSEVYRDQHGRTLSDYLSASYSANTRTWASASIQNGLAKGGSSFQMYLLDDSTVQGDITPSALTTVTNQLHIDTTAGQTIGGAIRNFASVDVNFGSTLGTKWKDTAAIQTFLGVNPESMLTIPAGTGTVTFAGENSYAGTTTIGAGKLVVADTGAITRSASVSVMSGAVLENHGRITIGNYRQQSGASLGIATDAWGKVHPLIISGTATLDGTLALAPGARKWKPGTTYTVLTADTISGKFSGVTGYGKHLTPKVHYGKHAVTLTLAQGR